MKKTWFLLLLVFPILVFAQNDELKEIETDKLFVGYIAAGVNGSQIAGDILAGYKKLGGNFGLGTFIMYSPKFSNSVEISYSMKGAQSKFSNNNPETFRKYTMDYIEIPLLFNYHDFDIAIFQAGFTYGRLLRNNFREGIGVPPVIDHRNWELGAVAGMTFLIKEKWAVNIKATFSLNNIINGEYSLRNANTGAIQASSKARGGGWYHNALSIRFKYIFW